jgi:catechol 2,3-dioxygenase-like lactoylglutathione lyase family enzyme
VVYADAAVASESEGNVSVIKVDDVAFVRFRAPDLATMKSFLQDFGMQEAASTDRHLFMRGHGPAPFLHATELGEPGFVGVAFRARSLADLERLADSEKVPIDDLDAPGGGKRIRLTDPDDFQVEVAVEQSEIDAAAFPPRTPWNSIERSDRRGSVKRVESGPSHVMRLGHCVLNVSNFRASEAWYKERFGFIASDEIELQPGFSIGAFLRCDRGDLPADHHSLFLVQNPKGSGFNHAAFEVRDFDDLMSGHDRLKEKARTQEWGVGRHVLGSQVFDYWRDPWGHTVEHWTDGDLFTAANETNKAGLAELLGVQWEPPAPPTMG